MLFFPLSELHTLAARPSVSFGVFENDWRAFGDLKTSLHEVKESRAQQNWTFWQDETICVNVVESLSIQSERMRNTNMKPFELNMEDSLLILERLEHAKISWMSGVDFRRITVVFCQLKSCTQDHWQGVDVGRLHDGVGN